MARYKLAYNEVATDERLDLIIKALEDEGAIVEEAIHCVDSAMALVTMDAAFDAVSLWTMLLGQRLCTILT